MQVKFCWPHVTGVLLVAAAPLAAAESPLPDPIAPAVIGRPLDQIRPARPVRQKPAAAKSNQTKQVAATNKAVPTRPPAPVAVAPAAVQPAPVAQEVAKQAPEHRAEPRTQAADDLAKGARIASKPPGPGAYFSSRDQALVRWYYDTHPVSVSGQVAKWKIGDPIPAGAALTGVPDALRAALPVLPPGHQYVQLDGDVVLVAVQSRRVVDGVSRTVR